ncbi:hypothetical protein [Plebeiibacterium sediminum]|uniref:Uncharacterized protein n=1 Tax=Plebeiibacterium sediminum TaxID=2992112 RepID=A0AAE3M4U5_9BACT|nr:hypothetical protein [Plebeiobacterium sediminum]MCW3787237.1 hypothetical protein [Plebeiobacterium sediminum]
MEFLLQLLAELINLSEEPEMMIEKGFEEVEVEGVPEHEEFFSLMHFH